VVGATASGKSALALAMARADSTIELVSVDSMQVYRRMDIGTAKPTTAERAEVPHHLIDIADPWEDFTVTAFADRARAAIAKVEARAPHEQGPVIASLDLRDRRPGPERSTAAYPSSTRWRQGAWSRPTGGASSGRWRSRSAAGDRSPRSDRD